MHIPIMNLLKKIKLDYNIKLFNDLIANKNFDQAYQLIVNLKKKNELEFFLLLKNIVDKISDLPSDFFKQKIIWTVSYDITDLSFINKFINFYIPKNYSGSFQNKNYTNSLSEYLSRSKIKIENQSLIFKDFVEYSNLYQNLLLFDKKCDFLFLETCASFFETSNNKFFTNPNICFCYFYIATNPETLFLRYKKQFNSTEGSFNEMFNFNSDLFLNSEQDNNDIKVYENRTNININKKSWTDPNVVNTFKGKIINYDDLLINTEEALLEIIFHLKQYGFDMDVNVEDIKEFISKNKIEDNYKNELSNKEKKFLEKNLDEEIPAF